jgi:hypothetical protein
MARGYLEALIIPEFATDINATIAATEITITPGDPKIIFSTSAGVVRFPFKTFKGRIPTIINVPNR